MQPAEWSEHGDFKDLMASQLRQLRRLIEDRVELDEDDFDLRVMDGEWAGFLDYAEVPVVVYEPDQFFFSLTYFPETHDGLQYIPAGHAIRFRPGEQSPVGERYMRLDWTEVRRYFANWLGYIARELDLVDDDELEEEPEKYEVEDEPVPIAAKPMEPAASAAVSPVATAPPVQPSWFQRAADWVKAEKEKRGALWVVVGFIVGAIITIIATIIAAVL